MWFLPSTHPEEITGGLFWVAAMMTRVLRYQLCPDGNLLSALNQQPGPMRSRPPV